MGASLDISDAYPEATGKIRFGNLSEANQSDILVVVASTSVPPNIRERMELLAPNKQIIEKIFSKIKLKKDSIVIMVTNPVEPLTYYSMLLSKLPAEKIIGFGNSLDTARLKSILSKKTKISSDRIDTIVIGEHGENMIPLFSNTKIDGKPIELFNLNFEEILNEMKEAAYKIRKFTGGVRFGVSQHLFELIQSILKDKNKTFPVSSYVKNNQYYEIEDVSISLPCKISANGISEVVEVSIDHEEKERLQLLANSLKEIQKNI